ncbi:MAG: hypothetical protein ABIS67_13725 [Candidatus Eisenbacteria bacterium]
MVVANAKTIQLFQWFSSPLLKAVPLEATMKKSLLMAGAMLALTAGFAAAGPGGVNLSWNDCGTFGTLQRNFACNVNTGVNTMVASVITGVDMPQLNGQAGVIDLQTNQAALSPWWLIGGTGAAPNCRAGTTITADFSFITMFSCVDPWQGGAAGGVNYTAGFGGPNRARIRTVCAIAGSTAINGVDEAYMFKVNINNSRSTGTGSCAGCTDGACIVLNSIQVTQPAGVGDYTLSSPITRNFVQWQGGGNIGGQCPAATPTRSATWGSVKSLYR